ncbi:MAG TPA: class I SAM-dependent methyltransferase [Methylotenera sp.]|nr:class I SAM-dependent methyltransferase [Methylotenera sp.]
MTKTTTFEELLNVFWLRPETALWREIDIRAMQPFSFISPSLDIGCGDGIFSFIRAGGKFDKQFDAFQAMSGLERFFDKVDVFDAFNEKISPIVTQIPHYQIDCGFDHKENLLSKASQLGLYKSLKQGDGNQNLPFSDDSFNSIFSNIVYWLNDPQDALKEISRILKPKGQLCLMLPNSTLPEYSFYNQLFVRTGDKKWAFLDKLDRGRFSDNIRQAKTHQVWEEMFSKAGLKVLQHRAHLSKVVVQTWDIGLRPLFPVLYKMAQAIPTTELSDIKSEWIATLRHFLEPLADMDEALSNESEPAFHCYILEK